MVDLPIEIDPLKGPPMIPSKYHLLSEHPHARELVRVEQEDVEHWWSLIRCALAMGGCWTPLEGRLELPKDFAANASAEDME